MLSKLSLNVNGIAEFILCRTYSFAPHKRSSYEVTSRRVGANYRAYQTATRGEFLSDLFHAVFFFFIISDVFRFARSSLLAIDLKSIWFSFLVQIESGERINFLIGVNPRYFLLNRVIFEVTSMID